MLRRLTTLALALGLLAVPALAHAETRSGYQNTDAVEAAITSVDVKTRTVRYHRGDPEKSLSLHVPESIFADLTQLEAGDYVLIEFGIDDGKRELIGLREM